MKLRPKEKQNAIVSEDIRTLGLIIVIYRIE
jgi:hypothetical protein